MKHIVNVNREIPVIKLALTGKLRSGKSLVGNHLYIRHGFDEVAFGDALKRTLSEVFPWDFANAGPHKPRALLQRYGQLMREIDEQVWVRHVERKVGGIIDYRVNSGAEKVGVVITDLRQPNEYEWAKENGFTIVRVSAPKDVRIERAKSLSDAFELNHLTHETESHIDGFAVDYEIVNDGTVDDLKAQIDSILTQINGVN